MKREFNTKDLKLNDIVTFENGIMGILIEFHNKKYFKTSYVGTDYYFVDLNNCNKDLPCSINHKYYNIETVRRPNGLKQLGANNWNDAPIIWDKNEVKKEETITITRHGRRTVAKYIVNGETVEKASSCCHKNDEFNFGYGAGVAITRLIRKISNNEYKIYTFKSYTNNNVF